MDGNKLDTKQQIFNAALRLFAANGYENVSTRTIADAVGIKAASIYYHYSGKEKILEACYKFYLSNYHITRLTKEQYKPIMLDGNKREVLNILNYAFPDDIIENMLLCLVVIFSRIYNDKKARDVFVEEINSSLKYLKEFFTVGIEIGRFHEFNVSAVSIFILSTRLFTAQSITLGLEQANEYIKAEQENYQQLEKLIPFIY